MTFDDLKCHRSSRSYSTNRVKGRSKWILVQKIVLIKPISIQEMKVFIEKYTYCFQPGLNLQSDIAYDRSNNFRHFRHLNVAQINVPVHSRTANFFNLSKLFNRSGRKASKRMEIAEIGGGFSIHS